MVLKFTEPVEGTGPLEKETKVDGGRSALGEDLYDIRAIKQLKSPTTPTASVERVIPIRRMQQEETYPSADSADVSLRAWGSCPGHFCTAAFYDLATDWRAAEGGRSCVPDETGGHQLCSPQGRESELTPVSGRRERDDAEIELNTSSSVSRGTTPGKSDRTDWEQLPDTDVLFYKPGETERSDRGLPCVADKLPHAQSSQHQEPDQTEKAQRQRPPLDKLPVNCSQSFPPSLFRRHSGSGTGTGALALSFLMLTMMLCSAAGSLCEGMEKEVAGMAVQKGEVILYCPVTDDVLQTKRSIIISYVDPPTWHEEVLGCDWLTQLQNFDCVKSPYGAKLIAIRSDHVLASLPEDRLHHKRAYQCKLARAGINEQFPDCHICYPADPTTTTTTTVSAVTLSATGDLSEPEDPHNKADPPPGGDGGLVTAVVVLSLMALLLLLILIGVGFVFLRFMQKQKHEKGYSLTFPEASPAGHSTFSPLERESTP